MNTHYTIFPPVFEFFATYNGIKYAAVRHNTNAPFSLYREGVLIGEAPTVEQARITMAQDSTQAQGQLVLF